MCRHPVPRALRTGMARERGHGNALTADEGKSPSVQDCRRIIWVKSMDREIRALQKIPVCAPKMVFGQGEQVVIQGLVSRSDLNAKHGHVLGPAIDGTQASIVRYSRSRQASTAARC